MASGDVDCELSRPIGFNGIFGDGIDDYVDTNVPTNAVCKNDYSINCWLCFAGNRSNALTGERVSVPYSSNFLILSTVGMSCV